MRTTLILFAVVALAAGASADMFAPPEGGSVVTGYQDSFVGTTLDAVWTPVTGGGSPHDSYVVGGDVLSVSKGENGGSESHLLVDLAYDGDDQEVLMLVRPTGSIETWGDGDPPRGGAATVVDTGDSKGLNYHMRSQHGTPHMKALDDGRQWSGGQSYEWQFGQWYWLRAKHENDGGNGVFYGKIWQAGVEEEPTEWGLTFDYSNSIRSGLAGIAGVNGSDATFDVDYFLLKADGLPQITVVPEPASLILLSIVGLIVRRR